MIISRRAAVLAPLSLAISTLAGPASELQAEIDTVAGAGGGIVDLPSGIIDVAVPLLIPPRIILRGRGPATILRTADGPIYAVVNIALAALAAHRGGVRD